MPTVHIRVRKSTLLERIVYGLLALVVVVLGFFFLAAALIAGVLLASVVLARLWWIRRRLRKAREEQYVRAEYTVVEREEGPGPRLPP